MRHADRVNEPRSRVQDQGWFDAGNRLIQLQATLLGRYGTYLILWMLDNVWSLSCLQQPQKEITSIAMHAAVYAGVVLLEARPGI